MVSLPEPVPLAVHSASPGRSGRWRGRAIAAGLILPLLSAGSVFVFFDAVFYEEDGGARLWHAALVLASGAVASAFLAPLLARAAAPHLGGRGLATAASGMLAVLLATAFVVLRAFPNSADEYGYLFLADLLAQGRLWAEPPPLADFFVVTHIQVLGGKWTSQYAPGWPSILALGTALRVPAGAIGPLVGLALLAATYALGRATHGKAGGIVAAILLGASSFFVFNAASYFNHAFASLSLVAFALAGEAFLKRPTAGKAAAIGLALGVVGLTRYFSALLGVLPFAGAFLVAGRAAHWRRIGWAAVGAAPAAAALLAYNGAITGDPLRTVTGSFYPYLSLGLWGEGTEGPHSPGRAIATLANRILELGEWSSPLLIPLYVVALIVLVRGRQARFFDFIPVSFALGFMLFPDEGGNRYGPRYWFEAYPFVALAVGAFLADAWQCRRVRRDARLAVAGGAVHVLLCLVALVPIALFAHRVVDERMDLFDLVARQRLSNAVVILRDGTGRLRPMPPEDLSRNGTRFDGSVLYARDLGIPEERELRAALPDRSFWVYEREDESVHGRLVPWRDTTP